MRRLSHLRPAAIGLAAVAIAGSIVPSAALGRTLVDPTTLTPPLKPSRICYQLGPYVQCDTSGVTITENEPVDELPCGQMYETGKHVSNSTRWYQGGLLVRRAVQEQEAGTWSLSPTGAGPSVAWTKDSSFIDEFAIPGDISSFVRFGHGLFLHVPALGTDLHESGLSIDDGDVSHGLFTTDGDGTDTGIARLCALLVG
jgi:hypothetical protein